VFGFVKAVEGLKPRGFDALNDITHLPRRPPGHIDLKEGKLKFSRITHKSILRPEFQKLSDIEQEAYLYRLARWGRVTVKQNVVLCAHLSTCFVGGESRPIAIDLRR